MDLKFTTCSMFLIQTGICAIFAPFLCPLRKDLFKSLSYISFYPSHPSATVFPQPNIFRLFRFSPLLAKYFPFQNIFLLFHFSPHFPSLNIFLLFLYHSFFLCKVSKLHYHVIVVADNFLQIVVPDNMFAHCCF